MSARTSCLTFLSATIAVFVFSATLSAADRTVQEVKIHSAWGGLGEPEDITVVVYLEDGRYVCDGKTIDSANVTALVAALEAPSIAKPRLDNLGITESWLQEKAKTIKPRVRAQSLAPTPNQLKLFFKNFNDPAEVLKAVSVLLSNWHTDDNPFVGVEVLYQDGSKLTAKSHSQNLFMLPWEVDGKDKTFNADISRSVSALLPGKAVNKERLLGDDLLNALVDQLMISIEREWNMVGTEDLAGDALRAVRQRYRILGARVDPWHDIEFGTSTYEGEPEEMNLHLTLQRPDFPPNVTDAVVLRYVKGNTAGVEEFLRRMDRYESLALSVPWLNAYIREDPKMPIQISYVHNVSFGAFGEKAMRTFAADMRARGREDLVERVRKQQSELVLLKTGYSYPGAYWLLFPDKHMMLWRYDAPNGLLKWTPADFSPGLCAKYQTNHGGCSGREVNPDGALAPEHAPRDQECMAAHRSRRTEERNKSEALFAVMDHDRAGFINSSGRLVIPLCFDKVGAFSEGLARFERDGNWGYIDESGSVVIEPRYPWAEEFSEGMARVQVTGQSLGYNGRWGFIDKSGKLVIDAEFDGTYGSKSNIGPTSSDDGFHDGLAKVEVKYKSGFVDKTGKKIVPLSLKYADRFSEGLAAAADEIDGKLLWGYLDSTGKWAIQPQFETAGRFSEHLAFVKRENRCYYIDPSGTEVVRIQHDKETEDCGTRAGSFSEGLATIEVGEKYGFIDRGGNIVIEPRLTFAYEFSEGLAFVRSGNEVGFIDKTGRMVLKLKGIQRAEPFHDGLSFVTTKDMRYGYINKSGKYVWQPTFLYNN